MLVIQETLDGAVNVTFIVPVPFVTVDPLLSKYTLPLSDCDEYAHCVSVVSKYLRVPKVLADLGSELTDKLGQAFNVIDEPLTSTMISEIEIPSILISVNFIVLFAVAFV
jgi:hypothetical protein